MSSYRKSHSSKKNSLPARWNSYTSMGNIVPGTRFLPFKTPLREEICQKSLSEDNWFTPAMLLEKAPNLKLVIDLTQTDRYYRGEDLIRKGVIYRKISCGGGGRQLPSRDIIHQFNRIIDSFLTSEDRNGVIGVHCTHGLNRTGYLICKYMVQRYGIPASEAVAAFENARGHKMERDVYVKDILGTSPPPPSTPHHRRQLNTRVNGNSYHPYSPMQGCYEGTERRYNDRYCRSYRGTR